MDGNVFEAVVTEAENLFSELPRRIVFLDPSRKSRDGTLPLQFLIDGFKELYNYCSDIFKISRGNYKTIIGDISDVKLIKDREIDIEINGDKLEDRKYFKTNNENRENLLYKNEIVHIEIEDMIHLRDGDLFWIMPRHGNEPMAIGRIVNIIKNGFLDIPEKFGF